MSAMEKMMFGALGITPETIAGFVKDITTLMQNNNARLDKIEEGVNRLVANQVTPNLSLPDLTEKDM